MITNNIREERFIFSCVIISAYNINDLNESLNIKNPHGLETFELVFNRIYLSLMLCKVAHIFLITLEIQTEDEENHTKIVLDRTQIEEMTIEEIKDYLKDECQDFFFGKR